MEEKHFYALTTMSLLGLIVLFGCSFRQLDMSIDGHWVSRSGFQWMKRIEGMESVHMRINRGEYEACCVDKDGNIVDRHHGRIIVKDIGVCFANEDGEIVPGQAQWTMYITEEGVLVQTILNTEAKGSAIHYQRE